MTTSESLAVANLPDLKQQLDVMDSNSPQALDPKIEEKADAIIEALTNFDSNDQNRKDEVKAAVEAMGSDLQTKASKQHAMLKQPLATIKSRSDDGGQVANALINLKMQIENLDPANFDFSAGWVSRLLGYIPGVGTPIKRYFSKFESAQTVMDAIIKSLENGRETLGRDNITLTEDQKRMRELTLKLIKAIELGKVMDQKLVYKLERDIPTDDPRHAFIQEEVLFALRQRISDLQQQLAVNQQGVLAMEIIIRNNKELMRGVNRALNVTVGALQVAVTVAMALENQHIVLEKVEALSKTTDSLIANTASRLKTQGAQIHKQAASTALSMDSLKQAFQDINAAMDDITRFRRDALPQMASNILEMDKLNEAAEASIHKLEKAGRLESGIHIPVE